MQDKKFLLVAIFFCGLLFFANGFADSIYNLDTMGGEETPPTIDTIPITSLSSAVSSTHPIAYIWGLFGTQDTAKAQGLWPLSGNNQNSVFYLAGEGSFADKDSGWMGGIGTGYRSVIDDAYVLGGYVFGSYNRSPAKHDFAVINPGIEALTDVWDFRVNGYFPLPSTYWYGDEQWASAIGVTNYMNFTGHQLYDNKFSWLEEVGPGFDVEIARTLPTLHDLKLAFGAYQYFHTETKNITGAEGRIEFPFNRFISLEFRDTYDQNQKNAWLFGVKLTLGGFTNPEKTRLGVASRLLDPVEHNFAAEAKGYSIPISNTYKNKGQSLLELDNIWFYSPSGTSSHSVSQSSGDGTFEHPFSAFTPGNLASIPTAGTPLLYFAPGSYDLSAFSSLGVAGRMSLPLGFSMYGRSQDFRQAQNSAQFIGGVDIYHGRNTLDSITIYNNGLLTTGVNINNAYNVVLNNIVIGTGGGGSLDFKYGIDILSSQNLNLANSIVNSYSTANITSAISVRGSTLNIGVNNIISARNNGDNSTLASGIFLESASLYINGNGNRINGYSSGMAAGVFAINSVFSLNGAQNIINAATIGSNPIEAAGIKAIVSNINITGTNTINASGIGNCFGIYAIGSPTVINITGANIFNIGAADSSIQAQNAYGIYLENTVQTDQAHLNVANVNFNIGSSGNNSWGIYKAGGITAADVYRLKSQSNNIFSQILVDLNQQVGP